MSLPTRESTREPLAPPGTKSFGDFQTFSVGKIEIEQAGERVANLRPGDAGMWKAVNLVPSRASRG